MDMCLRRRHWTHNPYRPQNWQRPLLAETSRSPGDRLNGW